jgi:predicted nucleic acid-binding protein
VKLVLPEPGADESRDIFASARRLYSSRLLIPETSAALSRAARAGRLTSQSAVAARRLARTLFGDFELVEVDENLADRAWDLASIFTLRGYDAVHLASLEAIEVHEIVLVASDGTLADAARRNGHAVAVPEARSS